jgi:DNA-binding NarL/FixJ family response regulator
MMRAARRSKRELRVSPDCRQQREEDMLSKGYLLMSTRILIVDDHSAVRRSLRSVLEAVPEFTVCGEAENGQVGIQNAQHLKPDAIILDISMPVMNGFDAAKILKSLMPSVPILMFTAFNSANLAEEALAAGASKVRSKSCAPDLLIRDLKALVQGAA